MRKYLLISGLMFMLPFSVYAKSCYKDSDCNSWEKDHCSCGVQGKCSGIDWQHVSGKCECAGSTGSCDDSSSTSSTSSTSSASGSSGASSTSSASGASNRPTTPRTHGNPRGKKPRPH